MDAREFYQLASKLAQGNSPAEFRTAIGRAYYATYNVGVEILEKMGFHISNGPAGHGEVRHHFNNSGDSELREVASKMRNLHTNRRHADYFMDKKYVERQREAQSIVEVANRLIETLDRCCFGPKRAQIIEAIKDWKQKVSGKS